MPLPTLLLASVATGAFLTEPAQPQRRVRPIRTIAADAAKVNLGPAELSPNQASPLRTIKAPFAEIPALAKLGKVPSDDDEVTVEGGRKLKFGEYKKWRDGLEQRLNELGFSLKEEGKEFTLRSATGNKSALAQQQLKLRDEVKAAAFAAPPANPAIRAARGARKAGTPARPGATSPSTVNITKNFSKQLGGESINLKLNADLTVTGKATGGGPSNALDVADMDSEFHLTAKGTATGTLLNKTFELARLEGGYDTDKQSDTVKLRGSLFVGGQQVWAENKTLTPEQRRGDLKKERSVEVSGKGSVPIFGPVTVSAEFGIRGTAGVKARYELGGSTLNGEVNPYIDVDGFAEGAVAVGTGDINLLSAGVYADLTFAKYDMKLGANVGLGVKGSDVVVFENVYWHNDLELLSGELGAFVKTPEVKVFGKTLAEPKTYKTELFDFDGFKSVGYLLNHSLEKKIGQVGG